MLNKGGFFMVHWDIYEQTVIPEVCSIRQHYTPSLLLTKKRLILPSKGDSLCAQLNLHFGRTASASSAF